MENFSRGLADFMNFIGVESYFIDISMNNFLNKKV